MAGRKVLNEEEARRCLTAVRDSRSELGAWAREHGIDGRSLNLWRVNFERRGVPRRQVQLAEPCAEEVQSEQGQSAVAPKLVELVVAPSAGVGSRARFVLHIGGVELEVGEYFDEASLRRLVRVLKSC